ncbi:MAG: UbiD family decarboxylase [Acidimicrobiia bacterium]
MKENLPQSFRELVPFLEARGDLVRVRREVDPVFEVSAVAKKLDPGPALLFESIKGHDMAMVIGTDGDRRRIADSIGVSSMELTEHYAKAVADPIPAVVVDDGPVQEVIKTEDIDVMREMPVLTHYEKDGGPYLTTGVVIAEDPERGIRNVSYHRLQVTGPDELRGLIVPRHLREMVQTAEAEDRPVPVAIVLGLDSAERLAAATWGSAIPLGFDELSIAGALKGRPEEIVRCVTVPVHVPAHAEIVIEAEILPHVRKPEGPFAEFTGNYGPIGDREVFRVKAITRRADAMTQGMIAFTSEHHNLLGLPYEPVVLNTLRGVLPYTEAVHITAGGCGKFHCIVRIEKRHEGDGKDAIIAALHAVRDIKQVVVVDNDVDPFDPKDVEWAIATRFRADQDLVVITGAKGNELDPSTAGSAITSKMGLDATKPLGEAGRFEKVRVPGFDDIDVSDYIT